MGLYRTKAAALAAVTLATSVRGQGFYYEDLSAYCPPSLNHQYLGCFDTGGIQPFFYNPDRLDPVGDLSKTYVHWDPNDFVNSTVTPHFCADTCRAHGFKYAATWNQQCRCGSSLDYTSAGGGTTIILSTAQAPEALCANTADPCPGDRRESCGTNSGARIWVDPSFEDFVTEEDTASLADGYGLLGCFQGPNLPSGESSTTSPDMTFPDPATCFAYCADFGLPLAYMSAESGGIKCKCGQDFGQGAQAISVDDNTCSLPCDDPTSDVPCEGQNCCGTANGPFPVYANPDLMGCYVPRIPGESDPNVQRPAPDSYNCFPTPQSILNRPSRSVSYAATTITRTGHFVPTAHPSAEDWTIYACYSQNGVDSLWSSPQQITDLAQINVETCTSACEAGNYDFAALIGETTQCWCANGPINAATAQSMQDCNQPCSGSDSENCGGRGGPLVYAKGDLASTGPWATAYTSSYLSTPIYSCTPTATTGTDTTTTTGTDTTTATETDTTTTGTDTTTATETDTTTTGTETITTTGTETITTTGTDTTTSTGTDTTATETLTTTGTDTITTTGTDTTTFTSPSTGPSTGPGNNTMTTSTGTGVTTTTSGVPGITDIPDVIVVLGVLPGDIDGNGKKRSVARLRRQALLDTSGGFVGAAGPVNPESCDDATAFTLSRGQLLSGGQPIATDPGVVFMPLQVNPEGSISTTFSIVNGVVRWFNDEFDNGEAGFCQIGGRGGQVYATFGPAETWPAGCEIVSIIAYLQEQCVDGQIVPSTPTTVPQIPTESGIYPEGQAPDDVLCQETTLSWIPGSPTFLPHDEL
ncbi:hypothetical protein F5X96DRAFT_526030 [Biscogniauxia mediterranea]|nr:hypothetical protein F5X96DRAFT_526030 [Biscogniauxia mediterranea]